MFPYQIIADGNGLTIITVLGLVFNQYSHLRSLIEPKLLEDRCQWLRSYLEYIKHVSYSISSVLYDVEWL